MLNVTSITINNKLLVAVIEFIADMADKIAIKVEIEIGYKCGKLFGNKVSCFFASA